MANYSQVLGIFQQSVIVFRDRLKTEVFINFAKQRSPEHVWLYTLQVNVNARAFYEKHGFVAEKFGVSPPPENEPDVEYHWRKQRS